MGLVSFLILSWLITISIVYYFYKKHSELKIISKNALNEYENILKNAKEESERIIQTANNEAIKIVNDANIKISSIDHQLQIYNKIQNDIFLAENNLKQTNEKLNRSLTSGKSKIEQIKKDLKRAQNVLSTYFDKYEGAVNYRNISSFLNELENIYPSVEIPLKAISYKDLKSKISQNKSKIKQVLGDFEKRYTTKQNRTIYKLMVIALQSELQNVLSALKYNNLDKSISIINSIIEKYISLASEGNQTIKPTSMKFIGEIQELFINAVKLEYEFYVRQQQMKDEQAALKERIRQETEERRYLLEQEKKVRQEEEKYLLEIKAIQNKLQREVESGAIILLKQRILELEKMLENVKTKKEEITTLQNGKAGFVYIISNLGSFGDNVFKIGMTRRLDPQDRIDELSNASVPFKFDVHSFIFSEDAVSLENALHKRLDKKRMNKITTKKEFFRCNIDELESLVYEIQPTASFIKTMLAEQYRMSLEIEKNNII